MDTFVLNIGMTLKIRTNINVCSEKNFDTSQLDVGQKAVGVVQFSGFGLVEMSLGICERGKNHVLIPSAFQSIANAPPPPDAKPAPYEAVDASWTEQPSFAFVPLKQSDAISMPVSPLVETDEELSGWVQPCVVCSV